MNEPDVAREENKCKLAEQVLRSCGQLHLCATGTSMLPTLWPGDLLTVRRQPFSRVLPGDLILYTRYNRFFIHRVIKRLVQDRCQMLVARGDALPEPDIPVSAHEFLGTVTAIKRDRQMPTQATSRSRLNSLLGTLFCRCDFLRGLALRLRGTKDC